MIAPPLNRALEHIPAATRFVHTADLGAITRQPVEIAFQAGEVMRHGIDLPRGGRVVGQDRTDDGLLVYVEPQTENGASGERGRFHGLALLVL